MNHLTRLKYYFTQINNSKLKVFSIRFTYDKCSAHKKNNGEFNRNVGQIDLLTFCYVLLQCFTQCICLFID
jgi:hypothetical protein